MRAFNMVGQLNRRALLAGGASIVLAGSLPAQSQEAARMLSPAQDAASVKAKSDRLGGEHVGH